MGLRLGHEEVSRKFDQLGAPTGPPAASLAEIMREGRLEIHAAAIIDEPVFSRGNKDVVAREAGRRFHPKHTMIDLSEPLDSGMGQDMTGAACEEHPIGQCPPPHGVALDARSQPVHPARLPSVLTHTYHPDYAPFGNICDGSRDAARKALADMNANGIRWTRPAYLQRRLAVESWLVREARAKITGVTLARPRYLFLGDFADGSDPARPASIRLPLASIPAEALTFTYPDSMTSFLLCARPEHAAERRWFHGHVFTLTEIAAVVAEVGLPTHRFPRPRGTPSDGFIEAQLWDEQLVRRWRDVHAR